MANFSDKNRDGHLNLPPWKGRRISRPQPDGKKFDRGFRILPVAFRELQADAHDRLPGRAHGGAS